MGADLEIRRQLQRHQKIGLWCRRQPLLCHLGGARGPEFGGPRTNPSEIFDKWMAGAVVPVMRIEEPAEHEAEIVDYVARRDQPERRVKMRSELRLREPGSQFMDCP